MTIQDRAYAVAIFLVLGICCIGAYVAVSGFFNANPNGLSLSLSSATETPTPGITIEIPTETAAPPTETPRPTAPPTKTPKGFVASPTPALVITRQATLDFLPTIPTGEPITATPAPSPTITGCGAEFCPRLGPPDSQGPKGTPCSQEYLWGFVIGADGAGAPNVKLHFKEVGGAEGDTRSKGPPDPAGRFDFPAASGTWSVQVVDKGGDPLSPPVQVQAGQLWSGTGNCPSRIDFAKQ